MLSLLQQLVDKELEGVGQEARNTQFRFAIRVLGSQLTSAPNEDAQSLTQSICHDLELQGKHQLVPR